MKWIDVWRKCGWMSYNERYNRALNGKLLLDYVQEMPQDVVRKLEKKHGRDGYVWSKNF